METSYYHVFHIYIYLLKKINEKFKEHIMCKNYNEKFTITAICDDEKRESLLPSSSADVTFLDAQHIPGSAM